MYVHAQDENKVHHWKVELAGALNNYATWEIEPSITYQPIRYLGISMGLLFCNPKRDGIGGYSQDKQWLWNSANNDDGSHVFTFRPSLQFISPSIWMGKDKDYGLFFSISPGLTIPLQANREFNIEYIPNSPGAWEVFKTEHVANQQGRTVFYHIKTALSLEIDERTLVSIGYTLSDFDLYGGSRNIIIEGKKLEFERHHFMHSFFIGLGYRF